MNWKFAMDADRRASKKRAGPMGRLLLPLTFGRCYFFSKLFRMESMSSRSDCSTFSGAQ
jgi:hypothetical protein